MTFIDVLFLAGRPFSPLYGGIMQLRAYLYNKSLLKSERLPVPVVSIGNLTMGGTGKTPTVQMIARYLLSAGYRPAVVSRGYGGKARSPVNIVASGGDIRLDPVSAGDEPYMLAASVPGLSVLTGRRRIQPCRYACEELGCDIILLDDGFQHLAVRRDIDIVLFNATSLAGNGRVFPGGELREPFSALARADAFLLTGMTTENKGSALAFADELRRRHRHTPLFTATNEVTGIFGTGGRMDGDMVRQMPFYAFSGIAHPERFTHSLRKYGISITGQAQLPDHARYTREHVERLMLRSRESGALALITTQKDWVKLENLAGDLPLYYLAVESVAPPDLLAFLQCRLDSFCPSPHGTTLAGLDRNGASAR